MRLCIIGTGYVGLVSAACFAETGNTVCCVDVNPEVTRQLEAGHVHIFEPGLDILVRRNHAGGRLMFTTSLEEGLNGAQFAFICVGTPPRPDGSCDLSHVEEAARGIGRCLRGALIVVNKSTVPVGTADRVRTLIREVLAGSGRDIPFEVVSNPEFLKEGDAVNDFMKPDRVIVGTESAEAAAMLRELYAPFARNREKLMIMGTRSAEMTKYAANCMLATKISFINEVACICEKIGADVRDVRTGIGADHRIGPHFIYPGLGYGGSCFPKDVKALIHAAREIGLNPELLNAVERVNERQKESMALRIREYFAPQGGVAGRTLAMWGLAFKANTDDMREAASLSVIRNLTGHGMRIRAFDPEAMANARALLAGNDLFATVDDQYAACAGADALLVVTEWNQFRNPDFDRVLHLLTAPVLFDGRNLYNPASLGRRGFAYFCIGQG
ncbi:MAG: UDP-glucose/GDP-mannose dehydrogenase family protein [Deltaproteobacteria bacterium]|jgi:UDPglucose 6-dehydrogenase|nr:UDP-glucose/GDP-mannose dehydrogenase family protein [Deltaproteobacteria bacterium]